MNWKIAAAKQEFSRLVREAAREPQLILNRDRIVAAVVDPVTFEEFQAWKAAREQPTLGLQFAELRQLCQEEDYDLEIPPRQDRANAFIDGKDDVPV